MSAIKKILLSLAWIVLIGSPGAIMLEHVAGGAVLFWQYLCISISFAACGVIAWDTASKIVDRELGTVNRSKAT